MRVNASSGSGPITVILAKGTYAVGETATFKPETRKFSKTERLTIRAEVLPDDPEWHTGRMPTLIHTMQLAKRGLFCSVVTILMRNLTSIEANYLQES